MKELSLFAFISLCLILFYSCSKDDPLKFSKASLTNGSTTEIRDSSILDDSLWIKPSTDQMNLLWADMIDKANVNQIGGFLYANGLFDWDYAQLIKTYDADEYLVSIPTIKNDSIFGVLFAMVNQESYAYWYVPIETLKQSTEELVNHYGIESTLTAVLTILKYEQFYGSYVHGFLYGHIFNPLLLNEIQSITSRGWCLIEMIMFDPDGNCPCLYYNNYTGVQIENVGVDFNPATDDPDWVENSTYVIAPNVLTDHAIIHGINADGYTVYHFWSWCPDEQDQNPWEHNWTNNTDSHNGGGSSNYPTPPNWDYDNPRWEEDERDCMFIFNSPHATTLVNQLEEQLITQTCTDAAEFTIKSIIDNLMTDLCNEYYDNQGSDGGPVAEFPTGETYDMNEVLGQINERVGANSYYTLGVQTCEVCEEVIPPHVCYNEVALCQTEGYEECVEEILCNYSLANFTQKYDLDLSTEEEAAILQGVNSCSGDEFEEEAIIILADMMDECGTYDFIGCHDSEDDIIGGICPESFAFINTGTTFTCDIDHIVFKYRGGYTTTIYAGDLCITVPKKDIDGNYISAVDAADLMSDAWDEAMDLTEAIYLQANHAMTSSQYRTLFVTNLRTMMLGYFDGTFGQGTMTVTNQQCSGNYPTRTPKYSIFC